MAANAADAIALGGTTASNHPRSNQTILYHHLSRTCMLIIEWTCIAGIPALMCINLVGLPPSAWSLPAEGTDDGIGETSNLCGNNESETNESMQFSLLTSVIASILSFIAILFFGDTQEDNDNNHTNKRGIGVVMGSNLIPLFYLALQLSLSCGGHIEFDDTCSSLEIREIYNSDSCTTAVKTDSIDCIPMAERGLNHLEFATLGGLSFAVSVLWMKLSQYNHRKYNSKRRKGSNDGEDENGDYVCSNDYRDGQSNHCSAVSTCWRIYLVLMVFQSAIRALLSADYDIGTLVLGILHISLIRVYAKKKAAVMLAQDKYAVVQGAWQDAFTPGEWMVVSTLITSLVGEYFLLYNFNAATSPICNSIPIHLIVAHAGLVGCLIGFTLCSFLKRYLPSKLGIAFSLVAIAGITVGCLEVTINSSLNNFDFTRANPNKTAANPWNDWLPLSAQWIFYFLSLELDLPSRGSASSLRTAVLGYWVSVFAVCLPVASMLIPWIAAKDASAIIDKTANSGAENGRIHERTSCSRAPSRSRSRNRKKRVIIARKYFHLVAIILFTPITWLDPDMMSLSYAIAIALLIVLEMVRGWTFSDECNGKSGGVKMSGTYWNQFYLVFMDEKDTTKGGLVVTHIALLLGCAFPLWVDQYLPQACTDDGLSSQSSMETLPYFRGVLLPLLPFLGVVVLGIGDSVGAIGGIHFGRHNWPGSSRTLEGSLCMFLCMVSVVLTSGTNAEHGQSSNITKYAYDTIQASILMGMITLVEASTTQIDNLCLPIAGVTLVLLMTACCHGN